ncbi:MAG: hypothetical protein A2Y97_08500 [Nitrospirae bacterium RBG_13_39_12]|nr:MAG: hypothetical protein A2Y97_08500 [Nitrospirae bacterium RBG_13_39_12]
MIFHNLTNHSSGWLTATADFGRVCQAWHRACEVKVLTPGISGAEGKEKGKGVTVRRGLEEAQSKSAGRRTGTG